MRHFARGYTLIEILIALTIMSLIFGIGFAGFRDYSRRQELETITRQLRGELSKAKEDALAGVKSTSASCTGVNTLQGHGVSVSPASGFYRIFYQCTGSTVLNRTINIPTGYTISWSPNTYFYFRSVGQGTSMTAGTTTTITITQTSTGNSKSVTVDSIGNIQ